MWLVRRIVLWLVRRIVLQNCRPAELLRWQAGKYTAGKYTAVE